MPCVELLLTSSASYHLDFGTTDARRRRSLDAGRPENDTVTKYSALMHTYKKRGIFDGLLSCPKPSDESTGEASCAADLADDDPADADDDDTSGEVFRKRDFITLEDMLDHANGTLQQHCNLLPFRCLVGIRTEERNAVEKRVKVIGCSSASLSPPSASTSFILSLRVVD